MAHRIYTTEGFVIGSTDVGEANRYLHIFTKDLGLIRAVARSVREEKSKLRYSLQDYSYARLSLVRGKDIWRVTGAGALYNMYYLFQDERGKLVLLAHIGSLLRRLLQGEEKNEALYHVLLGGVSFLAREKLGAKEIRNVECILVFRILYTLGYVSKESMLGEYLLSPELDRNLLQDASPHRRRIVSIINESLEASHL